MESVYLPQSDNTAVVIQLANQNLKKKKKKLRLNINQSNKILSKNSLLHSNERYKYFHETMKTLQIQKRQTVTISATSELYRRTLHENIKDFWWPQTATEHYWNQFCQSIHSPNQSKYFG